MLLRRTIAYILIVKIVKEKMNNKKNIGFNAVLNVIRQSLSFVFPIITFPYIFRALGAVSMGKITMAQTIVSYVALVAELGVRTYATREASKLKADKVKFAEFINEIYSINVFFTLISYILLICILFIPKLRVYSTLALVFSITIALTTIGCDWLNAVYEDFLLITIRSIISYILTFALLLLFVNDNKDYFKYAIISLVGNTIICITNRIYLKRKVKIRLILKTKIDVHLKPLVILFINNITVSLNTNFDIMMLGLLSGDYQVGLYSIAVKVYAVIRNVVSAVYAVTIPRLSYYVGNDRKADFKILVTKIWCYILVLAIPSVVGVICINKEIIMFLGSKNMIGAASSLQILALALVFSSITGIIMNTMNIPLGKEINNIKITSFGIVINICFNSVLIPIYLSKGAAISTIVSEVSMAIYAIYSYKNIKECIDIKKILTCVMHAVVGSGGIIIISIMIHAFKWNYIVCLGMIIIIGMFVYISVLILLKDECIYYYINRIKNTVIMKLGK